MGFTELSWCWICILVGCVNGNHFSGGGQMLLDPFRSSASSSASSGASSSGAVSSAWSTAGSGIRRFPGISPITSRRRSSQRGVRRGNMLLLSPMRSATRGLSQGRGPLFIVNGAQRRPTNVANVLERGRMGGSPPGVQFIGTSGRSQFGGAAPPYSGSAPILYVDGANLGSVSALGGLPGHIGLPGISNTVLAPSAPPQPFALDAKAVGARIPGLSNKLTIMGQTATGDLMINGPGGKIIIGAEVLNGITHAGRGLRTTEFEEMEMEGVPRPGFNGSAGLKVAANSGRPFVLQGKESFLPIHHANTLAGARTSVHAASVVSPMVLGGAGSISSSSSSASAGASTQAGTAHATASSSASSQAIALSSPVQTNNNNNAAGGSGRATSGGSITVRSGKGKSERVFQLGQSEGKTQVITLGGSGGVQLGNGGPGIEIPGNATIIIGPK